MQVLSCRDDILALTKQLVHIESIVNTGGEKVIGHSLYTLISSFPYFIKNPDHVVLEQTIDDYRERYNVLAYVKGTKGESKQTVILMGHMDTVGVDDFNQLKTYATDPDEWMQMLKKEDIPTAAKEQLDSGDWLFGRGTLDMKSGLASQLYLLKYYAKNPEQLDGNIVLVAECDEEDSSHGMISALETLKKWKNEQEFEYVACINADYVAPRYQGDVNRYVYKGTVGKLLPAFLITGEESHVGSCFEGLDPNFLAAALTKQIEYNPELCDEANGETTLPPVALKQTDLKPGYTVQTALSALAYYNFFIHSWSPKKVLEKLREQARIAFTNALETFQERHRKFAKLSNQPFTNVPWQPRVFLYEEMNAILTEQHGVAYTEHMNTFKQDLMADDNLDSRMTATYIVEEAWKWMEDKSPAMILFYASLYSPRVQLTEESANERQLVQALEDAVQQVQPHYEHPIVTKNFFPYISDMSFIAISDDHSGVEAVKQNNPAWEKKLDDAYANVRELNVPVINIGPYGMDAHSKLERMEMTYSLEIVPNMIHHVIEKMLTEA